MSLDMKGGEKKQKRLTPKQEKFCQNLAKGMNYSEAYKKAYNPPNMSMDSIYTEANKTMKLPHISQRTQELKQQQQEEIKYTTRDSFLNLELAQSESLNQGNINAYIKAEELKGKLLGLYTEKKDIEVKGQQVIFVDKELDE
jgi:hypothetical protein